MGRVLPGDSQTHDDNDDDGDVGDGGGNDDDDDDDDQKYSNPRTFLPSLQSRVC